MYSMYFDESSIQILPVHTEELNNRPQNTIFYKYSEHLNTGHPKSGFI